MKTWQRITIWVFAALLIVTLVVVLTTQKVGDGVVLRTRQQIVASDMAMLVTALKIYRLDTGSYPTTEEGLDILLHVPRKFNGRELPYIESPAVDPWKTPYRYVRTTAEQGTFHLVSAGADMKFGTEDDIDSRKPAPTSEPMSGGET